MIPMPGGAEPGKKVVFHDGHGVISSGKNDGCTKNFNFILFRLIPKLKTCGPSHARPG
jgi:hypothetical protein